MGGRQPLTRSKKNGWDLGREMDILSTWDNLCRGHMENTQEKLSVTWTGGRGQGAG